MVIRIFCAEIVYTKQEGTEVYKVIVGEKRQREEMKSEGENEKKTKTE